MRPAVINGLDKAGIKTLTNYGKIQAGIMKHSDDTPNLVEVMSCEGGCIAGPSVISNPRIAANQLKRYVESGSEG